MQCVVWHHVGCTVFSSIVLLVPSERFMYPDLFVKMKNKFLICASPQNVSYSKWCDVYWVVDASNHAFVNSRAFSIIPHDRLGILGLHIVAEKIFDFVILKNFLESWPTGTSGSYQGVQLRMLSLDCTWSPGPLRHPVRLLERSYCVLPVLFWMNEFINIYCMVFIIFKTASNQYIWLICHANLFH